MLIKVSIINYICDDIKLNSKKSKINLQNFFVFLIENYKNYTIKKFTIYSHLHLHIYYY
jgi:hypothetical protein